MEIGRFQVLGELGRGAMGVVYRAQDPKIGRTLAIKSIRLNELTDPEERERMRERLFREAQSAGILSHPNIVTIYDVSEENGLAYIFMEFVNGMALDEMLRSTPPPAGQLVLDLLSQTAAALDFAHKNGIIHRDIKPANIMVNDGRTAKVCDFGVAKIVSQQMTTAGLLMGTPSYMAPEQIEGKPLDGRSDQFALAVMVFDILTKEKPFIGDSLPILLYKICRVDPPSAAELNTTLGLGIDPVLRMALAKNPDDRYPTCSAFIAALRHALEQRPGWLLPGKGFPGDDSTTNSGPLASATADTASVPANIAAPPPLPPPPPPPAPVPPPTRTMTAPIPLPRPRVEARKTSTLAWLAPLLLVVLGAAGFLAYQRSTPKPNVPAEQPDAPPRAPTTVTTDRPKADPPKVRPSEPVVEPPPAPVKEVKEPAKDAKQFPVHFGGNASGAAITVDSDPALACKTPCVLTLPKGRHSLSGVLDGYTTIVRTFEVTAETTVPTDMVASGGVLMISSNPPGATVNINGQDRPEKTPARFSLKPGAYQIVVSLSGQTDSSTAIVKDGVTSTLNVKFP